jgi:hypothetical protein
MLLNRVEAILREREEFKKLEVLVSRLQAFIMVNKQGASSQFSTDDVLLIRELFGDNPAALQVSPTIHSINGSP